MTRVVRAFDFGGSGAKTAVFEVSCSGMRIKSEVERFDDPDYSRFADWLAESITVRETTIGVSCAGFVDLDTGVNHRWSVADLDDYPLAEEVARVFPAAKSVWCLNDVEAHLCAALPSERSPVLAIAIGTSIGMAVSDEEGQIMRTRRDRPLECGSIRLQTGASKNEVWWALGNKGLKEMQEKWGKQKGAKQFGYRVGAFAAQYAALFHARSVVLSGGVIADNWEGMRDAVETEFAQDVQSWMGGAPKLIASPWGRDAALAGVARYACSRE